MKTGMTSEALENLALSDIDNEKELEENPQHPDNFNIVAGKPLPEDFINPPFPKEDEFDSKGHFCVDKAGNYQPTWSQLLIEKIYEKQVNPQVFPLGSRYLIHLDTWTDAPPEVIESLRSAVETHHEHNAKPGDIALGIATVHKETTRRRFVWRSHPSAQIRK